VRVGCAIRNRGPFARYRLGRAPPEAERNPRPPETASPRGLLTSWGDDPYSRGAYAGYWSPGLWTAYGSALREPVGRIHWAGTETSARWNGKMEGALLSAQRVADEVLAELEGDRP